MKYKLNWKKEGDRSQLLDAIGKNKLFIGSTDTVLGLMGAVSSEVKQKIDNVKQREGKPYLILVKSFEQVALLADVKNKPHLRRFLELLWPAPVSVILLKNPQAPAYVGSADTVAIRMPDHSGLRDICAHLDYGLYSTSANVSGEPIPKDINSVAPKVADACCCFIDDEQIADLCASTIIDMTSDEIRVIRQGSVSMQRINEVLEKAGY